MKNCSCQYCAVGREEHCYCRTAGEAKNIIICRVSNCSMTALICDTATRARKNDVVINRLNHYEESEGALTDQQSIIVYGYLF